MPDFEITSFGGMLPRVPSERLNIGYASLACDVNLLHGTLRPWHEPRPVAQADARTRSVFQLGQHWETWTEAVDVALWRGPCARLYTTSGAPYPLVAAVPLHGHLHDPLLEALTWWRAGVPAPSFHLQASAVLPSMGESTDARDYVYTFGNGFGEEGAPSHASAMVDANDGDAVALTGFETPPAEWGVTTLNLYRRVSGFRTGNEPGNSLLSDYQLVETLPIGTVTYVDRRLALDLGRSLETRLNLPPPPQLAGITAIPGTLTLAGYFGNCLRFCVNGQPGNWPEQLEITLDEEIRGLAALDGLLYVATTGRPHVFNAAADPGDRPRAGTHPEHRLPMVADRRGIVATPLGVVYVGQTGLVLLHGAAPPVVISDTFFARDDWALLAPHSMRLGYHEGTLFCVSDNAGFVLTLDHRTCADWTAAKLSTISDRPVGFFMGDDGALYLHRHGLIAQWDAGERLRPYAWRSGTHRSEQALSFHAARVEHSGEVQLVLRGDGRELLRRPVPEGTPFNLPARAKHRTHTVTLEGVGETRGLHLATSRRELRHRGSA